MVNFQVAEPYRMDDLLNIMELLRSPGGCPWDRAQTHQSIRANMLEEAYEAAEAIDRMDMDNLREELGDVLLQVVFHSAMAREAGRFTFDDVVDGICKKLVFRHPHVFGTAEAGVPEGEQIEHKMLSNAIEKAQKKIENNNYGIRENLLKYDEVANEQREVIYAERRKVLDGDNMRDVILKMVTDIVEHAVDMAVPDDASADSWDIKELNDLLLPIIPLEPVKLTDEQKSSMKKNELKHMLKEAAIKLYEAKEAQFPDSEQIREVERVILLKVIDNKWMSHIDDMEQLRQGIGLQAYGQRDPLVEYKMSAYEMFDGMTAAVKEDTVRILFHIRVEQKVEREPAAKVTGTNKDDSAVKAPVRKIEHKVYPNDPCPCGSGKKYKQCCGRIK